MPRTTQREPVSRLAAGVVAALVVGLMTVAVTASPAAAASLTVTTAADVVADDGLCSLREAIEAADTDTASGSSAGECPAGSGADVITFAVAGPVVAPAWLTIDSDVTIDGGVDGMVLDGSSSDFGPYFQIEPGAQATFESVTITGTGFSRSGGAIVNRGTTIVSNSMLAEAGLFPIVSVAPGDLAIVSSTISGNSGWGVHATGPVTIVNSTISGNSEPGVHATGPVTIDSSTITANEGRGIEIECFLRCDEASVSITASVVAANGDVDLHFDPEEPNPFASGGFNVIGDGNGAAAFTAPGDVTAVVNAGLGPLGDNGGPTHTHALLEGSPAIDRVTAPVGSDPATDQRRVARPQGSAKDTGAFERDEVVLLPGGFGTAEGQSGSQVFEIPISLSRPSTETITVDYVSWPCEVFDGCGDGLATQGVDYADPGSGTLTFLPGEMTKTVPVTVYGDLEVEPAYLWGEWFLVRFLNPSPNAVLDSSFFGLGAGVIGSDDP